MNEIARYEVMKETGEGEKEGRESRSEVNESGMHESEKERR